VCDRCEEKSSSVALFQVGLCIMIICTAVLIFEMFTAFWFSGDVFGALDTIDERYRYILIITPVPVGLFLLSGIALQAYYTLLLAAMAASVIYIIYKAVGPLAGLIRDKDAEPVKNTALFEMTVLFAALYAIEIAFILIINAAGIVTESPIDDVDLITLMYSLLNASVWEEVVSRILLIGVPMLVIALAQGNRETKLWKYLTGGFGMSRGVLLFIFFSAAMFGLAHVPGWAPWKFFSTFLFGLIAGYLFVKYGVYATIAMHFLTNYLMSSEWMFGDGGMVVLGLVLLAVMFLGIPYVWVYAKRGVLHLRGAVKGE